jgi:hypothetical protein
VSRFNLDKKNPPRREDFFYSVKLSLLKLNYFLRARAPAAATETTARDTARPTKSSAPVFGFGLLVSSSTTGSSTTGSSVVGSSVTSSSSPSSSVERT